MGSFEFLAIPYFERPYNGLGFPMHQSVRFCAFLKKKKCVCLEMVFFFFLKSTAPEMPKNIVYCKFIPTMTPGE